MPATPDHERLFHISEEPGIKIFNPRPSPSHFDAITGDVVFAISDKLLHNYLLPRDCPRVTYYASPATTPQDKAAFFGHSTAKYIVTVEAGWYERIKSTTLYRYELPADTFALLDKYAGYYISYDPIKPTAVIPITDAITELLARNVELRFTPNLNQLAGAVAASSLNFSLIRMRNAKL